MDVLLQIRDGGVDERVEADGDGPLVLTHKGLDRATVHAAKRVRRQQLLPENSPQISPGPVAVRDGGVTETVYLG